MPGLGKRLGLRSRIFCGLLEKLGIKSGIDFDLLELRDAAWLAVLLVFVFIGHGEAVGVAPVRQIGFTVKRALLAHAFVLFAQDVAGLGIHIPANPGHGSANIDNGGIHLADLFGAIG